MWGIRFIIYRKKLIRRVNRAFMWFMTFVLSSYRPNRNISFQYWQQPATLRSPWSKLVLANNPSNHHRTNISKFQPSQSPHRANSPTTVEYSSYYQTNLAGLFKIILKKVDKKSLWEVYNRMIKTFTFLWRKNKSFHSLWRDQDR